MTDVNALRALIAAATKTPWRVVDWREMRPDRRTIRGIFGPQEYEPDGCGGTYDSSTQIVETDAGVYGPTPADADLIVAAVNALPGLIDELEQAASLRSDVEYWRENCEAAKREWREAATERDAYRSMLCDLVAAKPPEHAMLMWDRARDLLKNGPKR